MTKRTKFYETTEFIELQQKWYDKLSSQGFKDSEAPQPKKGRHWESCTNFDDFSNISKTNQLVRDSKAYFTDCLLAILHYHEVLQSSPDLKHILGTGKGKKITRQDCDLIKLWIKNKTFKDIADILNILYLDRDPKMLRTGKGKSDVSYFLRLKSLAKLGSTLLNREAEWKL